MAGVPAVDMIVGVGPVSDGRVITASEQRGHGGGAPGQRPNPYSGKRFNGGGGQGHGGNNHGGGGGGGYGGGKSNRT